MKSIIERLWYRWVVYPYQSVVVRDGRGHTLTIPREWLHDLVLAEILNAAEAQEKRLVWESEYFWRVSVDGMRSIIEIAQQYDDSEIALIAVMVETSAAADLDD